MERPGTMNPEDMDLETLIGLSERLAMNKADGHLTVMRFTTGWKVFLGTPNLDNGSGRAEISNIEMFEKLHEALIALLLKA